MKTLYATVVGCGSISKNHFKALKSVEHVCYTTVCDINLDETQVAVETHGVHQMYSDYKEPLKDPDIDVAHIYTPHYLHARMVIDALKAGKHMLCEKSMALTKGGAKQVLEARERRGKYLGICFQSCYNQTSACMKQLMDQGTLGRVLGVRGWVIWGRKSKCYSGSPWRGRWVTEGGSVLINQVIHTFDLLQWSTGCRVTTVDTSIPARRPKGATKVEDVADTLMTREAGERLTFCVINYYVKNVPAELEIICEHGSVKITGNVVVTDQDGIIVIEDYSSETVLDKDHQGSGHRLLISDFYHCTQGGQSFPAGGEETIVGVGLSEAMYRSAKTGISVRLGGGPSAGEYTIKTGEGDCI